MDILEKTERFLITNVKPIAEQLELEPNLLLSVLQAMIKQGLLNLQVESAQHNDSTRLINFLKHQEIIARYSGALAFLQVQHQAACGLFQTSDNSKLRSHWLPLLTKGEVLSGIAFSHLRRREQTTLSVTPQAGGYLFNGETSWVTGWGLLDHCIIAAISSDQNVIFGFTALKPSEHLQPSAVFKLIAMQSAQTVSCHYSNLFVANENVVLIKPSSWFLAYAKQNILVHTSLSLGCAQAGLDILLETVQHRPIPTFSKAAQSFSAQIQEVRCKLHEAALSPTADLIPLRVQAATLSVQIALAASTINAGKASLLAHPIQRIYREAFVFNLIGQNVETMEALLTSLLTPSQQCH